MEDFGTLCLIGIISLGIVASLLGGLGRRMGGGMGGSQPDQPLYGDERPQYDDPNISSRGAFGGRGTRTGGAGFGGGLFGGGGGSAPRNPFGGLLGGGGKGSRGGGLRAGRPGSTNSPNITTRGGFGRSRK